MKFIVIIFLLILFSSCAKVNWGHKTINIINNSNKKIVIYADIRNSLLCPVKAVDGFNIINSLDSNNQYLRINQDNTNWELRLSEIKYKWYLTVYDKDSFIHYSCDTINKYKLYNKQIELNLDSLLKNNWTITYP